MGAGSIIYLLRKKYNIQGPITAIEKDKVVIDLAKKYFGIDDYLDLTIVNEDAFQFTSQSEYTYDLVIVDLFIDDIVPEIFASHQFITNLRRISSPEACLIYNKMTDQPSHKKEFAELFEYFEQVFPGTQVLKFGVNDSENSVLFNNAMP